MMFKASTSIDNTQVVDATDHNNVHDKHLTEINYFFLWEFRPAEFSAFAELTPHESVQELNLYGCLFT